VEHFMERGPGNPDGTLPDDSDVAGIVRGRRVRELSTADEMWLEAESQELRQERAHEARRLRGGR